MINYIVSKYNLRIEMDITVQLILVIAVFASIYYLGRHSKTEAFYVESTLNKREYLVQNLDKKEEASYMLSVIHERIFILRDHFKINSDRYKAFKSYIEQFINRIGDVRLYENPPDGTYTSFTVNKGDEIALCLRSMKTKDLHDINLVMYVVLHELSHVACPELDHTELFKKIFTFFLEVAIELKIYKKVDYSIDPHEYCGMTINENLLK